MTSFIEAKTYLARVLPWPEEGQQSYVNVHWSFRPADLEEGRKLPWSGRACRTVSEAVSTIEFCLGLPDTRDIYVCMSQQGKAIEKTSRKGRKYLSAARSSEDAVCLKALYIDIDFKGGDHGYDTPREAGEAFAKFLADTKLPAPSLKVHSGGGIHIYWVLAEPLKASDWDPLAFALANAIRTHGLKCDVGCTVDRARVLRIPDTLNRKQEQPRPVRILGQPTDFDYSVERIAKALEPYKVAISRPAVSDVVVADPAIFPQRTPIKDDDLSSGIEIAETFKPDLKLLRSECGFVEQAFATGGATYQNPVWNLTTLISTFAENGRKAAHLMGWKHPGYSFDSTNELYDRKVREVADKNLGWPQCRTINANLGPNSPCKICPHLSKGKSPLNFAPKAAPAPVANVQLAAAPVTPTVTNDLPDNYERDPDGRILKLVRGEAGAVIAKEPICIYPFINPWIQKGPWSLNWQTETPDGLAKSISILFEAIGSTEARKILGGQGMTLFDGEIKAVTEFLVSWINQLKKSKDAVVATSPFGWNVKDGKLEGFVYGGNLWTPTGPRIAPVSDYVTRETYSPTGDIQVWRDAAAMITDQDRPALDAVLASAFAAPLVRFTGQTGLQMSLYSSESGIGKTTAMEIAQAVWANPTRAKQGLDDTGNSTFNKLGELRNLPLYWDELKTEDQVKKYIEILFRLTGGKEKARLTSRIQQRSVGTWQTLLVSASNESLIDAIESRTKMTTAGIYRVFEYAVPRGTKGQISSAVAQRTLARCNDNYGGVGLAYSQFLGGNFMTVDKEVEVQAKALEAELVLQPDERFWSALVSTLLMGARYANHLGFTQIKEAQLKAFLVTVLGNMRAIRAQAASDMSDSFNVVAILHQFLTAMRARHTLVTNRIHIAQGKPPVGSIKVQSNTQMLDSLIVQIGADDKLIRISSTALGDWLRENGFSRSMFMRSIQDQFGFKLVKGRIGSGTTFATPTIEYCIQTHLDDPSLQGFVEI